MGIKKNFDFKLWALPVPNSGLHCGKVEEGAELRAGELLVYSGEA
jgi:hypothetical protein